MLGLNWRMVSIGRSYGRSLRRPKETEIPQRISSTASNWRTTRLFSCSQITQTKTCPTRPWRYIATSAIFQCEIWFCCWYVVVGGGRYQSICIWECREILSDEEENRNETSKDRRDGRKRLEGRRTKGARKSEGREGEGRHQADPQDLLVREILLVHNFRKLFGVVRSWCPTKRSKDLFLFET